MSEQEPPDNPRGKLAAIAVIVLLLAAGWWLVQKLGDTGAIQDCVATGHRDCGNPDTTPR